jgi:hypothetical protein
MQINETATTPASSVHSLAGATLRKLAKGGTRVGPHVVVHHRNLKPPELCSRCSEVPHDGLFGLNLDLAIKR